MANSANPEINKKIATSALGTLVIATVFFYLGDRYAETLVTYPGQIFDHLSDAFLSMWQTIKDAPFALDMTSNSLLFGGACFLIIWMIWLRYVAFIGNYRSGEESGSARWGTVKEGKKFKDLQTEDNNLLFTKNFGLALHRPKFDPEYDRNLNVLVVGGSGSGKTFNYVTPNICQLNTSYFVTDPKGTLLKDAGYLFTDNGYKLKSFNTINLDESMHYNPLKYVKTDTDILSFVNCFIMNTNPEGKSSGDPFWENAEKMLYTALIALLRDWFPAKDYNMSSLLTLLSLAEAREKMTMRTLVSITGALSVSVLAGLYIYFVLGLNVSDCTYFIYAVSLPFWCVGFVKPCGMPFEQFAPLWLKANFTNDRIFYKPSMRLAGLLSESENSKQKGTIYGKHYRKQGNLRGIESYSPRAGRVIS